MKKLMIATAIVCAAAAVQAASFTWQTKSGSSIYQGSSKLNGATAYIFDSATVQQSDLVSAFVAGTLDLPGETYLDSLSVSSGKISADSDNPVSYGAYPNSYDMYFAIFNNNQLYISGVQAYEAPAGEDSASLKFSETSASRSTKDASAGYSGAGWYVASVPEPFSGALALLGMGAIALRRKMKKAKKA